jgi:hypothetical protein
VHCHWRSWSSTEGQDQSNLAAAAPHRPQQPPSSRLALISSTSARPSTAFGYFQTSSSRPLAPSLQTVGAASSSYRQKSRFGTASPPYLARDPFVLDLPRSMVHLYSIRSLRFSTLFLHEGSERSQREMRFGPLFDQIGFHPPTAIPWNRL